MNIKVTLSLPFHCEYLVAKSFKFILKEPLGVNFSNIPTLVLSFKTKNTSIELAANDEYFTLYSIFKSEKAGMSIESVYWISVMDGKSFTATNGAAISTAQSKFGGASALFDGTNDYLTTTYNTSLLDWWTANYTLEMWVYAISFPAATGSGGSIGNLIGNMSFNSDTNYWSFGTNSSGNVKFYYYNGSAQSFTSNLTLSLNVWTHLALVKSSAGVDIYVNGVKSSTTHTIVGTPLSSAGTPLTIGAYTNGF